jgi:hypothetical protein
MTAPWAALVEPGCDLSWFPQKGVAFTAAFSDVRPGNSLGPGGAM